MWPVDRELPDCCHCLSNLIKTLWIHGHFTAAGPFLTGAPTTTAPRSWQTPGP